MSKFLVTESKNSPRICFDPGNNHFEISGRSYPENAERFYEGALEWIDGYSPEDDKKIEVNFMLQYVSSSSVICVLQILKSFEDLKERGGAVSIHWKHQSDDEDILATGEDLASLTSLEFEYSTF
ncbi:MAG TPA: DUF1987 domain-containing protein [Flavobacteriales bacterium]|nr:DUF1987 domain-containing protein [Flavobacteriales bacterium]